MMVPASVPSREQILYWLHEAAELEHNLMCCYLYAAFSLKRVDANWSPDEAAAVKRWYGLIQSVAMEEMGHLCIVGNLMTALGANPHFNRPMFPVEAGPYPAGFAIRLQAFSPETIEHFLFLERPEDAAIGDGPGFAPTGAYRREVPEGRLSPGPFDYTTVGQLYNTLACAMQQFVEAHGEAALFIGDPGQQVTAALAPLPGVCTVTDLESALAGLKTIVTQGEGASREQVDSHFHRFERMKDELCAMLAANPSFEPAWAAATNPVMNRPLRDERVHVNSPDIAPWLDIGNALYTTSLRCLMQGFNVKNGEAKRTWLSASYRLMRAVVPVGQGLAARPAQTADGSPNAGLTFTSLRTLAVLPERAGARFVAERIRELKERAEALPLKLVEGEYPELWYDVIASLDAVSASLDMIAGAPVALPTPTRMTSRTDERADKATSSTAVSPAPAAPAKPPEIAEGKAIRIAFDAVRCIHSRHCVLEAPTVFKANTPGEWIFPDTMEAERLAAVAMNCPSGAIRFTRKDGGLDETAPPVNTLKVRENGPYAIAATLRIDGEDAGFRATLCRCGASKRKPYCDGSHAEAGFTATGEPPLRLVDPLPARDGVLNIVPKRNGPLEIEGPLELCAGTGRVFHRDQAARLCRCGQSKTKPFCDLSHVTAGFEAEGR
jgi:CDGSH-type Zn-finger protein/uncharacterized Fe-S cluster protein YjdI